MTQKQVWQGVSVLVGLCAAGPGLAPAGCKAASAWQFDPAKLVDVVIDPKEWTVRQGETAIFTDRSRALAPDLPLEIGRWTGPNGQRAQGREFRVATGTLAPETYWITLEVAYTYNNRRYTARTEAMLRVTARTTGGVITPKIPVVTTPGREKPGARPVARIKPSSQKVRQGERAEFYSQSAWDPDGFADEIWTDPNGRRAKGRSFSIDTAGLSPATYHVTLEVVDNRQQRDQATATLVVLPRQSGGETKLPDTIGEIIDIVKKAREKAKEGTRERVPVVARIAPRRLNVYQGEAASYDGNTSEPSGRISWRWKGPADQRWEGPSFPIDTARLKPREYKVELEVTDVITGDRDKDTVELVVVKARKPAAKPVALIEPRIHRVKQGQQVTFESQSYPDDVIDKLEWTGPRGKSGSRKKFEVDTDDLRPDSYEVILLVADKTGTTATDRATLVVEPARPAERHDLAVTELSLAPDVTPTGATVVATATVANRGQSPVMDVAVRFSAADVGFDEPRIAQLPPGQTTTVTARWRPEVIGEHKIDALVDPRNAIAEADETNNSLTRPVTVLAAPVAKISPNPHRVTRGEAAPFVSQSYHPGAPSARIESQAWTGPPGQSAAGATFQIDTRDLQPGPYLVALQVRDNFGMTASDTATLEVVEAPVVLPDLVAETLDVGPERIRPQGQVPIRGTVSNAGQVSVPNAVVTIAVDGTPVHRETLGPMLPGDRRAIVAPSWRASAMGGHEVLLAIEPAPPVTEVTTDNNRLARRVTVVGLPDLLFPRGVWLAGPPSLDREVTVEAIIRNQSDVDAAEVVVAFRQTGLGLGVVRVGPLPAGAERPVTVRWRPPAAGRHLIEAIADPSGAIDELNEDNNRAETEARLYRGIHLTESSARCAAKKLGR